MSAASVAECPLSETHGQQAAYIVGFLLVPGGGLEPPRPCGLRILSPFFDVLQRVAIRRKLSHKLFIFKSIQRALVLQ
jgi:hypothetical protein